MPGEHHVLAFPSGKKQTHVASSRALLSCIGTRSQVSVSVNSRSNGFYEDCDYDADGNICAITVQDASTRADIPRFSYEQVAA